VASVRSKMACIGVDTSGDVSVLFHLFGFIRARVPTDPDTSVTSQVSVLDQVSDVGGTYLNLNVIRVGFDARPPSSADDDLEKLDYAVYKTRNVYQQVSLGVGRVEHYFIDQADAGGRDDLGSTDEADQLSDEWSVPNDGIDCFVVRNISASDFVGISPVGGSCDKGSKDDGLIGGEINRGYDAFARTFAHEVGHYVGLSHNHSGGTGCTNCPASDAGKSNLMAQTRCTTCSGGAGVRDSTLLTSGQGSTMRGHCATKDDC
jgi:hypothetical protein